MRANDVALSLRFSLLASLGLLPLACSGTIEGDGQGRPTCTSPQTDATTGIVSCQEGYSYRPKGSGCASSNGGTAPASGVGTCSSDACDSDVDCEAGYHCASILESFGASGYACQTNRDTCFGTQDCAKYGSYQTCVLLQDGHRECVGGAVPGRPFLVESQARHAPIVAGGDWRDAGLAGPRLDLLTAPERAALAKHWTEMGQMEHASIAAFARFSLQLLSLGAPPELIEACTQALADETAHARLCFGVASAYAGRAVGPGPLDVTGSLEVTSLADIVELVIAEGCFGETSAALQALEAAEHAADPVIAGAYSQIARDEQRHAELAFRFVRWALERDPGATSVRIARALCSTSPARAVRDVVEPCLEALLKSSLAA